MGEAWVLSVFGKPGLSNVDFPYKNGQPADIYLVPLTEKSDNLIEKKVI